MAEFALTSMTSHRLKSIVLLLNYWEYPTKVIQKKLSSWLQQGSPQVATFIPWQAAESDISHSLHHFLQLVAENNFQVSLIVTPELGLHYPHSGFPKDLVSRADNLASDSESNTFVVHFPPNTFVLPSLLAPELMKRYALFLGRIESVLEGFFRTHPQMREAVQVCVSGSLWKYYRGLLPTQEGLAFLRLAQEETLASSTYFRSAGVRAFAGDCGDRSRQALLHYRSRLETLLHQREFNSATPSEKRGGSGGENRWKSKPFEEASGKWLAQQAENGFRQRTLHSLTRKNKDLQVQELEIYTPEVDPLLTYARLLQGVLQGAGPHFQTLSHLLDAAGAGLSMGAGSQPISSWVHWTAIGGFQELRESERCFLFLKSLLLACGRGGGVFLDEAVWSGFSDSFRQRAEGVAALLQQKKLQLRRQALYFLPHLWSRSSLLWEELQRTLGVQAAVLSQPEELSFQGEASLLIVDGETILTQELLEKLLAWVKGGHSRVLVLPRSPFFTELARKELEAIFLEAQGVEINLGFHFSLYALGQGRLLLMDPFETLPGEQEPFAVLKRFLQVALSLAGITPRCSLDLPYLEQMVFHAPGEHDWVLFILNPRAEGCLAHLTFSEPVLASDLGARCAQTTTAHSEASASHQGAPSVNTKEAKPCELFALEVPAFGVLPLQIASMEDHCFSQHLLGLPPPLGDGKSPEKDTLFSLPTHFRPTRGLSSWS